MSTLISSDKRSVVVGEPYPCAYPLQEAVISSVVCIVETLYIFVVYHCFVVLHCLFFEYGRGTMPQLREGIDKGVVDVLFETIYSGVTGLVVVVCCNSEKGSFKMCVLVCCESLKNYFISRCK